MIFPSKTLNEAFFELEEVRNLKLAEYCKSNSRLNLFEKADSLLYEAKKSGKNRTVMSDRDGITPAL